MELKDCIEFATANPACYLATTEGDQPHVRGLLMWFADETGFYFHTGLTKQVCQQLKRNPRVEACFFAPDPQGVGTMMRVTGTVEFIEDIPLKTVLLEERPFLKEIGTGLPDDPMLVVFRIAGGEVHFWTMEFNMRENEIERVRFQAPPWPTGHYTEKAP